MIETCVKLGSERRVNELEISEVFQSSPRRKTQLNRPRPDRHFWRGPAKSQCWACWCLWKLKHPWHGPIKSTKHIYIRHLHHKPVADPIRLELAIRFPLHLLPSRHQQTKYVAQIPNASPAAVWSTFDSYSQKPSTNELISRKRFHPLNRS